MQFLPQKKVFWMFIAPALEALVMCLSLVRSLRNRMRLLKSLNIPRSPLHIWSWCWPHPLCSLVLAWRKFFWYKQYTSLLSDTHHKKLFYSWNRTEKVDFKPFAIFRRAQVDSVSAISISGQQGSIYMEGAGERHATCMHNLKQQMSDSGQLTHVKRV